MRRLAAILLAVCVGGIAPALAQDGKDGAKVELRAEEVLLDLVITDGKGRPMLDIKPDEVEVYEGGKRQDVTSFGIVQVGPSASGAETATAVDRRPAQLTASPFRQFNLVLIVVDRSSIRNVNLKPIQEAATDFVEKKLAPNDLVAVFALGNRPLLVQNFTNDRPRLVEAIKRATSGAEGPLESVLSATGDARNVLIFDAPPVPDSAASRPRVDPQVADTLNRLNRESAATIDYVTEQVQARALVQGLFGLVKTYDSIPDRKSVVLYSEGIAIDSPVAQQFSSLISLANRTNFTFYAVDAAGLRTGPGAEARSAAPVPVGAQTDVTTDRTIVRGGNSELGRAERDLRTSGNAGLNRIAEETGGVFIKNTNDLRQGLDRLASDLRSYYALTYAPADASQDGSFRPIQVKVTRKDAKVRTRSGYYAVPGGANSILLPYEQPVLALLGASDGKRPTALRADARAEHFAGTDGWLVPVVVGVSGEGLEPLPRAKDEKGDGPAQFEVDVVVFVRDASRTVVAKMSRQTFFGVERDKLDQFRKTFYSLPPFPDRVVLGPGRYTVTVAVYDPVSKKATVVERAIALGDAPSVGGPALSSLVVGRGAQKAAPGTESDPFFVPGGARIDPSPDGRLVKSAGDKLISYFRFYGKPGADYRMKIDFLHDGKPMVSTNDTPLPVDAKTGEGVIAKVFPLDSFQPGSYTARVTVTVPGGSPLAATVDFVVEP